MGGSTAHLASFHNSLAIGEVCCKCSNTVPASHPAATLKSMSGGQASRMHGWQSASQAG